jgi:hypothetical protein
MPHLSVTLAIQPGGAVDVTCRLDGVALHPYQTPAQIPDTIAGAPTLELDGNAVTASDDRGSLPLIVGVSQDDDGVPMRCWKVLRETSGPIEYSYAARPTAEEPRAATPPLELRAEGSGLSGALKCFVLLPPGPEELTFDLRWIPPAEPNSIKDRWVGVSSLGEDAVAGHPLRGEGLEQLGDTYFMGGDLRDHHLRNGHLSTWWLTPPGIDVDAFSSRLGATYDLMSRTFGAPAHPYRIFLRAHLHRGANASAHPASFVMAMNPSRPLDVGSLYETIAHELVHEWLHLDGPDDEKTWFVEGSADYYSLVLPLRAGMLDDAAFLEAVNFEARECYANPQRGLSIQQAQELFFSDFMAHRLPYARGMFYLADLDARLRRETSQQVGVDDLIREVVRDRSAGERVGIEGWCARVQNILQASEMPHLNDLVLTGAGRPSEDVFGPQFEMETVKVPIPDFGFDSSTLVTGHVRGLVPGGAADRAGLQEGEHIELPRYPEIVRMNVGDVVDIGVNRGGHASVVTIPLTGETVLVPQWRKQGRATS